MAKWAVRQSENTLTEGFVTTLEVLREREPIAWGRLMELWFGWPHAAAETRIITQVVTPYGRPDVGFVSESGALLLEVKLDADLGPGQMPRYRAAIGSHGRLAFLGRTPPSEGLEAADRVLRWREVGAALQQSGDALEDPVAREVGGWFLAHLRELDLMDRNITYSLGFGYVEMRRLMNLLKANLKASGIGMRGKPLNSTARWVGLIVGKQEYAVGLNYSDPYALSFETLNGVTAANERLDLIEAGFFDQSPRQQAEVVHSWIGGCLEKTGQSVQKGVPVAIREPIGYRLGQGARDLRLLFETIREILEELEVQMKGKRVNFREDWVGWVLPEGTIGLSSTKPYELVLRASRTDGHKPVTGIALDETSFFEITPEEQRQILGEWCERAVKHLSS